MGEDQISGRHLGPMEHLSLDVDCAVACIKPDLAGEIRLQDTN